MPPIATTQIRPPRRPASANKRPVPGRRIRRRGNSGTRANFGNCRNSRNPRKIAGWAQVISVGQVPDPRKPSHASCYPPISGPGCRQSRPRESFRRGARNPHASGPFRGAGSDAAGTQGRARISEIAGIPEIPGKSKGGRRSSGGPVPEIGRLVSGSALRLGPPPVGVNGRPSAPVRARRHL